LKKAIIAIALAMTLAGGTQAGKDAAAPAPAPAPAAFTFVPGSLVITRSVYDTPASALVPGVTLLPPNCVAGAVVVPLIAGGDVSPAPVVACTSPIVDATYPTVFQNDTADAQFGVTSPILLDNISTDGHLLGTLPIPTSQIVTSFSSKSELALHLSSDGKSLTFVGYHGGPGFLTGPGIFDVSNGNTPGLIDPTNTSPNGYYRSVAEVDASGHVTVTDGNAYSGDNGRGAFKGSNGLYYMVGNDNSGNLSKKQVTTTIPGEELVHATGAELLYPGQAPPVATFPDFSINKIGTFSISQVTDPVSGKPYAADKAGKDDNYRGITIFNDTLYITKGSGSNGINTVYQVGTQGTLPSGTTLQLAAVPINILPGFPATLATGLDDNGNPTPVSFPFGIWFANANTLYVCDEGDGQLVNPAVKGNVATAVAQATAGVQKWVLNEGVWTMSYVLQDGLKIGMPYDVDNYPASLSPATGGCRNMTGQVNGDGTATIFAVTSTISPSGDQGADPNLLVRVTDVLSNKTVPSGNMHPYGQLGKFKVIRRAQSGEVIRGVDFAPQD
jgi:hypothetical protein